MTDAAMLGTPAYERRALDAYWTPAWCTEALLSKVWFRGLIWEPAAGRGDICRVLDANGYDIMATDIADHGYPCGKVDFLATGSPGDGLFSIVTNPPYAEAERFVRHAIDLTARASGMVAMLLRNEWDCAASRRDLFEREPFACKLVLTKRPRWFAEDKASPRHNFAWFVWDHRHSGPPTIGWLP